jgi:transient receptor potential cation channel subfamily A protein 1
MQVVLHTELERKLPQFLLEKVDKMELIEFPNDTKCKLGFLDTLLRKWFWNPFSDDGMCSVTQEVNAVCPCIILTMIYFYLGNYLLLLCVCSIWTVNCLLITGLEMVLDSSDDYVSEELVKQKRRLKEISSALETQQLLLRLIVQV